jgi:metal-responsive CopG/Arc/MetJ family transcriptional regulator
MALEADLVSAVDKAAKRLKTTRSALTRVALRRELKRMKDLDLEKRHREGYFKRPVRKNEFDNADDENVWPAW